MRTWQLVLLAVLCGGCALRTEVQGPVSAFAASPVTAEILDNSVPEYLFASEHHGALIFCATGDQDLECRPTILRHTADGWVAIDFGDLFDGGNWQHVCAARDTPHLWGIVDHVIEGPGWDLQVVFSPDGGETWSHVASIRKPFYMSYFHGFRMDSSGKGALVVHLEYDYGAPVELGYYTYLTSDRGETWSTPRYTEDILLTAYHAGPRVRGPIDELMKMLSD